MSTLSGWHAGTGPHGDRRLLGAGLVADQPFPLQEPRPAWMRPRCSGTCRSTARSGTASAPPGPEAENGPVPAEFDPNTGTITVYKDLFETSANSQIERGR